MVNKILLKIFTSLQDIFASYWFNRLIRNFVYTAQHEKIKGAVGIDNRFHSYCHNKVMFKYIPLVYGEQDGGAW